MEEVMELKDANETTSQSVFPLTVRQIKSMPRKSKNKLIIDLVIVVLCVIGLIAFSTILFNQFNSGNTVVKINYEIYYYNKIPGITICFLHGLSLEKIRQKYPQLLQQLEENFNQTVEKDKSKPEDNNDALLAINYGHLVIDRFAYNSNYTIKELFDLSIPFREVALFNFSVKGICRAPNNTYKECDHYDSDPIETMVFGKCIKCFTFFSHLNPRWRNVQMHIYDESFYYFFYHDEKWYPTYVLKEFTQLVSLSMHSPDEFPQYNTKNFIKLKVGHNTIIKYNRIKMKLLGPKFDTNCNKYNIDAEDKENKMRSNCLKYCVKKGMDQTFDNNNESFLYDTSDLWTSNEIDQFKDHKFCIYDHCRPEQELVERCETECKLKCIDRFYNYNYNVDKYNERSYNFEVIHNQLPDQITEHIPETTPIEFISNFGGLLGMWLGLSALAILKFLMKIKQ